ncbi:FkbM family methyltransferase [Sphingomonas qomolangmaensis]|uniref:FkbM family methyltransferase n=1 Tax=Sphingomonas qomolangmaensis TaxID=2918765 RepID=A0ABY5L683_9SPHN|nr:FkbM family methyltransferase [Sphingomonas qomolangmaensis]UUL82465.1 FkbM family methyltransferase [Sphingomonas qomolangmaensis]
MVVNRLGRTKALVREGLPARWRVPAKYWHARLNRTLEPEMRLLRWLVPSGARAIDVGGNYGAYAYALHRLGARVEVFEPNPMCLAALQAWAAGRPGLGVHDCALSAVDGSAALGIPVDSEGVEHDAAASIERLGEGARRVVKVALRRLDSFGITDAALLKIDVEGHEAEVIEGALATIAASCPAILIEIEQRHRGAPIAAMFERIESLGYHGFFLKDEVLVPVAGFRPTLHQSLAALGVAGGGYYNNFLFLARSRVAAGEYQALLA